MAVNNALAQKVISEISPDELAQLVCDLSNIHSPTGHERTLAEFILDWYRANGIKAIPQIVDTDRVNAVGILKGTGTGLSLMFNGHLDTSFTGTDEDPRPIPIAGVRDGIRPKHPRRDPRRKSIWIGGVKHEERASRFHGSGRRPPT